MADGEIIPDITLRHRPEASLRGPGEATEGLALVATAIGGFDTVADIAERAMTFPEIIKLVHDGLEEAAQVDLAPTFVSATFIAFYCKWNRSGTLNVACDWSSPYEHDFSGDSAAQAAMKWAGLGFFGLTGGILTIFEQDQQLASDITALSLASFALAARYRAFNSSRNQ